MRELFSFIFDQITDPFSLPVDPVYEWAVLGVIGLIAFFASYRIVGTLYQHKGLTDMFYTAPAGFIAAERDECLEEAKQYDYVALEVSGEELLEVLGSGQEAVQKAGTEE